MVGAQAPRGLSLSNLNTIKSLNVENLSTGVEALQDKYLGLLNRPYNTKEVKAAVERAVNKGFKCFNVDFIFALPNQTYSELEQAGHELIEMGWVLTKLRLILFSISLTLKWESRLCKVINYTSCCVYALPIEVENGYAF